MREMIEGVLRAEAGAQELISDYEQTFPDASPFSSKPKYSEGWLAPYLTEPGRILYKLIWCAWITALYPVLAAFYLGITAVGTAILAYFGSVLDTATGIPLAQYGAIGLGGLIAVYEIAFIAREYRASLSHSPWE